MTKNKHIIVSYDKFDVGILMKRTKMKWVAKYAIYFLHRGKEFQVVYTEPAYTYKPLWKTSVNPWKPAIVTQHQHNSLTSFSLHSGT